MAKQSRASLLAAQEKYFAENNIYIEKKENPQKKYNIVSEETPLSELGITSVEDFGDYIYALQNNKMEEYRNKRRERILKEINQNEREENT